MTHSILFVDDELKKGPFVSARNYVDYYVLELEESKLFSVTKADSADEALQLVEETQETNPFALAILDVMMPKSESLQKATGDAGNGVWTGISLAIYIHAKWPNLPIILLTNIPRGSSDRNGSVFQDLLDQGVVKDVLFKLDNTPEDLLNKIVVILDLKREP